MKRKIIKQKKSQSSVIESVLLLAMGLMIIYYIYQFTQGIENQYKKNLYFYSQYIISEEIFNKYEKFKVLKESIGAKNITYTVTIPKRLFGTTYYLKTKNISGKNFLIFYLPGSPFFFRIEYNYPKHFYYISGENKEHID